jgi:hypothetical protein
LRDIIQFPFLGLRNPYPIKITAELPAIIRENKSRNKPSFPKEFIILREKAELERFASRFTGFLSFIGYYPVVPTSKKFEFFEVYILSFCVSGS